MERTHPTEESAVDTFSGFEIVDTILQEVEAGATVTAISEKYNVPAGMIYQWKALFLPAFRHQQQLKALKEENARLQRFITDAMADGIAAKAHILSQISSGLRGRIRPRGVHDHEQSSSKYPDGEDNEPVERRDSLGSVDPKP